MSRLKWGYKLQYSYDIIDHIKAGKTIDEFAKDKCVTVDAVYMWFEKYPSFYDAYKIATRNQGLH